MSGPVTFRKGEKPQPAVIGYNACPSPEILNLAPIIEECRNGCKFRKLLTERREEKRTVPPAKESDMKLFEAIKSRDKDAVEQAIQEGANVNCKDRRGERPIDIASRMGELEIFVILKKQGASY